MHLLLVIVMLALVIGCQKPPAAEQLNQDQAQPAQPEPNPRVEGADVTITVTPVAGSVYMLEGQGGNIGVSVGPDGVLMIDDQFAPLAPKIRAAIEGIASKVAGARGEIEFLINTHYHGDHTGGNPIFGKEAHIVAHANVRKRVSTDQQVRGRTIEALPEEGWPVVTYEDGVSLHVNGEEVRLTHMPTGHTDGDSAVYFTGAKVLHTGDLFFNGRFPFVDLESGGDVDGYPPAVTRMIEMLPADGKIIPGHGPLATVDDLRAFQQMIMETTDIVRKHMAAGKTLDQIKAAGLPAKYESWGSGFINTDTWLATIHASLSR